MTLRAICHTTINLELFHYTIYVCMSEVHLGADGWCVLLCVLV